MAERLTTQAGSTQAAEAQASDNAPIELTYLQAISQAMLEEFRRDANVIIMGQDVRANIFGATPGFVDEFGSERVLDVPISENSLVGAAAGAAMTGLRPIVDLTVASFVYNAFDQLMSQVAKNRYLFGGQATIPVTYRALFMYQGNNAAQHSDRPHSMLMNMPGIKIAVPSTPADAKGLLTGAIRADDPVVVFEDTALWPSRAPVPQGEYVIPFGVADIKRQGHDVTVVAIGATVRAALDAAEELARDGISVEVIDPRTLVPLDWGTILGSVAKTRHLVVVDLANRTCSAASEIAATVAEEAFDSLAAAPVRVTAPDTHIPFSSALLHGLFPSSDSIVRAVRRVLD